MTLPFRYRRLGYVALNVTDIVRSDAFYREMVGLEACGEALHGEKLYRCTSHHHDVILHAHKSSGLRRVAWEMEDESHLDKFRQHASDLGISTEDVTEEECAALGIDSAFRLTEPNSGATFEYFANMSEAQTAFSPTVTNIVRLGHVVLNVKDYEKTEDFFTGALNYRVSDRIDNTVSFMRCFPNPLHHSLGLSNSDANQLHHVNFMVTDIDDIGKAIYRAQNLNAPIVFGPGRHPPSESIFFYFLDPDGITLEYSFGMEEFPEIDPREPRRLPMALESIDYWGGAPQQKFGKSGQIEASSS